MSPGSTRTSTQTPAAVRGGAGGTAADKTWGRLFLTTEETFALTVLLVASEGWNRSVVHRLRIPEHNPAAGELFDIHTVEINKAVARSACATPATTSSTPGRTAPAGSWATPSRPPK
jgi:hypothetical protein